VSYKNAALMLMMLKLHLMASSKSAAVWGMIGGKKCASATGA
jgi:hypothetical protein